jgi:hypothetical protein
MAKKNKLKGKFVVAYDTVVDGNQCMMTEENGKEVPFLFDSYEEAFKELFDGAYSMLSNRSAKELKEYNEGVTKALVKEMGKVLDSGDVKAMEKFLNDHPECNDGEEWVESAETFTMNRKTFFTGKGVQITGKKLK